MQFILTMNKKIYCKVNEVLLFLIFVSYNTQNKNILNSLDKLKPNKALKIYLNFYNDILRSTRRVRAGLPRGARQENMKSKKHIRKAIFKPPGGKAAELEDGEFIKKYNGIMEVERALNISRA